MTIRIRSTTLLLAIAVAACGASAASASTRLIDTTRASFSWAPASGPVHGYYVVVSRNSGPPLVTGFSADTSETVSGEYGDTIVVQVAAYDASGVAGPLSPPSDTITFSPPLTSSTGSSTGTATGGGSGNSAVRTPLDFSGDGASDLLMRDLQRSGLALWRMNGADVTGATALPEMPSSWKIVGNADYDGNGVADILWQEDDTDHVAIWSLDAGSVTATLHYDLAGLEAQGRWTVEGSGDFDGDGRDDFLLFNRSLGVLELLHQDAASGIASWARIEGYRGAWSIASTLDLDGDGIAEITWQDEVEKHLITWRLDGAGLGAATPIARMDAGWRVIGSGDHNGDGKGDLVLGNASTRALQLWFLDGATITSQQNLPEGIDAAWSLVAGGGDYDADGNADLVWTNEATGEVSIWFTTPPTIASENVAGVSPTRGLRVVSGSEGADDGEFLRKLCNGDFNGDGTINIQDFGRLRRCVDRPANGSCADVDIDGDAFVDANDFNIWSQLFGAPACSAQTF